MLKDCKEYENYEKNLVHGTLITQVLNIVITEYFLWNILHNIEL